MRKTPAPIIGDQPDYLHPMMQNLIGWWPLADGGGSTAFDLSLRKNNGLLTLMDPASDWVIGQNGSVVLNFDGSNDFVDLGSNVYSPTGSYTLSAWIRTTVATSYDQIFSQDNPASSRYWQFRRTPSGTLEFVYWFSTGTLSSLTGTAYLSDGKWHHVVASVDSATAHIFVDGKQDGSKVTGAAIRSTKPTASVCIGMAETTDNGNWPGDISDVRMFSSKLTQTEIINIYHDPWSPFSRRQNRLSPQAATPPASSIIPHVMHYKRLMTG